MSRSLGSLNTNCPSLLKGTNWEVLDGSSSCDRRGVAATALKTQRNRRVGAGRGIGSRCFRSLIAAVSDMRPAIDDKIARGFKAQRKQRAKVPND